MRLPVDVLLVLALFSPVESCSNSNRISDLEDENAENQKRFGELEARIEVVEQNFGSKISFLEEENAKTAKELENTQAKMAVLEEENQELREMITCDADLAVCGCPPDLGCPRFL